MTSVCSLDHYPPHQVSIKAEQLLEFAGMPAMNGLSYYPLWPENG